mmetsp:Transcript_46179/g.108131  ORF Transcript_46179/g.108131 Transcript_46179/m.108131 type:complete len:117 (-) Transcript_46179:1223-1573(-)
MLCLACPGAIPDLLTPAALVGGRQGAHCAQVLNDAPYRGQGTVQLDLQSKSTNRMPVVLMLANVIVARILDQHQFFLSRRCSRVETFAAFKGHQLISQPMEQKQLPIESAYFVKCT